MCCDDGVVSEIAPRVKEVLDGDSFVPPGLRSGVVQNKVRMAIITDFGARDPDCMAIKVLLNRISIQIACRLPDFVRVETNDDFFVVQ